MRATLLLLSAVAGALALPNAKLFTRQNTGSCNSLCSPVTNTYDVCSTAANGYEPSLLNCLCTQQNLLQVQSCAQCLESAGLTEADLASVRTSLQSIATGCNSPILAALASAATTTTVVVQATVTTTPVLYSTYSVPTLLPTLSSYSYSPHTTSIYYNSGAGRLLAGGLSLVSVALVAMFFA